MKIEYGLTDAVYGFIFMTDAARQRCSKDSTAQSGSRIAAAVQGTCPGRHRVGARVFDLPSASPSLHPTGAATETANPGKRRKLAFTVKLPRSLIPRVRLYARARKLPV